MPISEQVLTAAQARAQALADGDAASLRQLLHPDFSWVSHRGEVSNRDNYIANNTTPSRTRWRSQRLDQVHVVVAGTTAILRCIAVDTLITPDGEVTVRMPMTQTWIREDGRWQCLAGHAGPRLG